MPTRKSHRRLIAVIETANVRATSAHHHRSIDLRNLNLTLGCRVTQLSDRFEQDCGNDGRSKEGREAESD